jgi:plastocyanin
MRAIRFTSILFAATCAVTLTSAVAEAGVVSGVVRTRTRPDTLPATAIVYAEPVDAPPPRAGAAFALIQKNKTFQPQVLVAPAGSTVTFPNLDPIFHNVFSLSGPQPFDLGLYRAGEARSRTFQQPGTYRVFCNIHPEMTALVLVVPTPYVTFADAAGRFALDLPPGRYRVTAVSQRASAVTVEVVTAAGATDAPELTLDESAWVAAQHKNKYGQDYPVAGYRR